jgi:hypothetical protein
MPLLSIDVVIGITFPTVVYVDYSSSFPNNDPTYDKILIS